MTFDTYRNARVTYWFDSTEHPSGSDRPQITTVMVGLCHRRRVVWLKPITRFCSVCREATDPQHLFYQAFLSSVEWLLNCFTRLCRTSCRWRASLSAQAHWLSQPALCAQARLFLFSSALHEHYHPIALSHISAPGILSVSLTLNYSRPLFGFPNCTFSNVLLTNTFCAFRFLFFSSCIYTQCACTHWDAMHNANCVVVPACRCQEHYDFGR